MQYFVNNDKKSALVHALFRGGARHVKQKLISIALVVFSIVNAGVFTFWMLPEGFMPTAEFILCLLLLAAAFTVYASTLLSAYGRSGRYTHRTEESITVNGQTLIYSYRDDCDGLRFVYRIPLSRLTAVERHPRFALYALDGPMECRVTDPNDPDDEGDVRQRDWLELGDYFEGIDLGDTLPVRERTR